MRAAKERYRLGATFTGGNEAVVIRAVRWLLKRLGRDYGIRVTAVECKRVVKAKGKA